MKAQKNLGAAYSFGEGVPKDYVTAYAWFNLAAAQGVGNAKKMAWRISDEMTADQIAEAQRLSSQLQAEIEERKKQKP